uniref:Carbonyl reductase [NADPH] 2-like isoform X1 n=1 Tax=Tanacetum cinerariifolium TaxID=118510 RepID=A0A6L2N354_TANCI|nr:carbonyl reductase [NADPH] 2-like isoform X1 [Tanacetum cinerariifolium]
MAEKMVKYATPLNRWLDPKTDMASTVIYLVNYLVSDDSRYMTETTIFVDGARSVIRPCMKAFIYFGRLDYDEFVYEWVKIKSILSSITIEIDLRSELIDEEPKIIDAEDLD